MQMFSEDFRAAVYAPQFRALGDRMSGITRLITRLGA